MCKRLFSAGVLTGWDAYALERYCDLLVQSRMASDAIAVGGLTCTVIDSQGRTQEELRPEFHAQIKLAGPLAKLEAAFGITPADRARITVDVPKQDDNPKDRFFKKVS